MSVYQAGAEVTWHAPSWRKNVLLLFLWLYQVMTKRAVLGCGERNVPAAARDGGQRFIGLSGGYGHTSERQRGLPCIAGNGHFARSFATASVAEYQGRGCVLPALRR